MGMISARFRRAIALPALAFALTATGLLAAPLNNRPPSDDVFYMYMPIAWRNGDSDTYRFGDFVGMREALPYLDDLGITAIWMTPIFPSPAYHGYQHGAGDEVNPRLGTEPDFWAFVAEAHARGIKVFIDFVVYGVSHDSIWYQSAYGNRLSPYDDWFSFTNVNNTSSPLSYSYSTWNGDAVGFIHWNLNNSDATTMITGWAKHWLDPDNDSDPSDGIDGFRLDHVSADDPDESPWGYDINWWMAWKSELLSLNPDVFTFAEQEDWGSHGQDLLPAFDAAMTKPFLFDARYALANETAAPLYSQMSTTLSTLPAGKLYLATLGDHDVDRLNSVIGGTVGRSKSAAAVLMLQPFPPVIYYGDELAMQGTKQSYGGDANDIPMREPFKWDAVPTTTMSNYWVLNAQAYNNSFAQNNDGRSVEEQEGVTGSVLETYRELIATRHAHSALRHGTYFPIANNRSDVWSFLRYQDGDETLLVVINLAGVIQTVNLDMSTTIIDGGSSAVVDVVSGATLGNLTGANKSAYPVNLAANGYRVLAVDVAPDDSEPQGLLDGLNIPGDFANGRLAATQENPTDAGDNVVEANQLFVQKTVDGLQIGITGNLPADSSGLILLFDTQAGGQSSLITSNFPTPPWPVPDIDGMTMDAGFAPDVMLFANASSGRLYVDRYTMPAGSLGNKTYLGYSNLGAGEMSLTGGSNPNGMILVHDNRNTAGISDASAADAATATAGLEGLLPFADIQMDPAAESIKLMAFVLRGNGDVSNQFLPSLPVGTASPAAGVDLNSLFGQQYVQVSLIAEPVAGDYNNDGVFNLSDMANFGACMTGPDPSTPATAPCHALDFDDDNDIDVADFGQAQQLLGV